MIVEDDSEILDILDEALRPMMDVTSAKSRDSALRLLERPEFDFYICDLRIPTVDGGLDSDVQHGQLVISRIRQVAPGTSVVAFSAYGDVDIVTRLLDEATQEDPFGHGINQQMVYFLKKSQLPDCIEKARNVSSELAQLKAIEITAGASKLDLSPGEALAVRVFARRCGAAVVRIASLSGGLSDSKTVRLRLEDGTGARVALVVAKLAALADIEDETRRYNAHVGPSLPVGSFTPLVNVVRAGARGIGAALYTLAEKYDASLFDLLKSSPPKAVQAVGVIKNKLAPWREGAPTHPDTVAGVRRAVVDDDTLSKIGIASLGGTPLTEAEVLTVQARSCCQHCDLHGENILVDSQGDPVLIDFGSVGRATASLDPVTLELSLLFHPAGRALMGSWPTIDHARHWNDLETYLIGCPVAAFVRACRNWAFEVAGGGREVYANVYGYAIRQIQYPDVNRELGLAVAECAIRVLKNN